MTDFLIELLLAASLLAVGMVSLSCFVFGLRILQSDNVRFSFYHHLSQNFRTVWRGEVKVWPKSGYDYLVHTGLARDRQGRWVRQGSISDEALLAVLRKH